MNELLTTLWIKTHTCGTWSPMCTNRVVCSWRIKFTSAFRTRITRMTNRCNDFQFFNTFTYLALCIWKQRYTWNIFSNCSIGLHLNPELFRLTFPRVCLSLIPGIVGYNAIPGIYIYSGKPNPLIVAWHVALFNETSP